MFSLTKISKSYIQMLKMILGSIRNWSSKCTYCKWEIFLRNVNWKKIKWIWLIFEGINLGSIDFIYSAHTKMHLKNRIDASIHWSHVRVPFELIYFELSLNLIVLNISVWAPFLEKYVFEWRFLEKIYLKNRKNSEFICKIILCENV